MRLTTKRKIHQSKPFAIITILLCVIVATIIFAMQQHQATLGIKTRHVALGLWTQGLFDANTQTLHPEKLREREQLIQKKVAIAHYYRGWEALIDPGLITEFATLQNNGWSPMLNANPYFFDKCQSSLPLYQAIAQGACDEFLHAAGKNLRNVTKPFYFVFAWEMNNDTHTWSVVRSASTSQDFVMAWQRMHRIFRQEKVNNIIWVFCPNIPDDPKVPYTKLYPGNSYVDWVGLDGYNWGTTQSWSEWISFSGVFKGAYTTITTIAPNKPVMLAEVNTTDQGGDKAAWYKDMLVDQIPTNFPKVQAVVFFDEDKTKEENVNWRIDVTAESLQAFIDAIHTPTYE